MPILSNLRHEAFAQALAEGLSANAAYERAGYKANDGNCIRLKGNDGVQERLLELRAVAAKTIAAAVVMREEVTLISVKSLTQMLLDDRQLARELGQAAAAVSAVEKMAKLAGVWIERSEVGAPGDFDGMTDADLRTYIAVESAELGFGNETVN